MDEGQAHVDDGAVRFGMPDDGVTAWDDLVLGPIEVKNETIEDLIILRSDGRPTYNFASPVEDWLDGITRVIRGQDHVPNTPKQIQILRALGRRAAAVWACPVLGRRRRGGALEAARVGDRPTSSAPGATCPTRS